MDEKTQRRKDRDEEDIEFLHQSIKETDPETYEDMKREAAYREAHPSNQPLGALELITDLFEEINALKRELAEHMDHEHSMSIRYPVDIGYKFDRKYMNGHI